MHWIAFGLVVYVACVLQTTLMSLIAVHTIRPDLFGLIAVYYLLQARRGDALLASWLLGLAVDLNSLNFEGRANVGLWALVYGLMALPVVRLREWLFRDHLLAYVACVLLWTVATQLATGLAMANRPPGWEGIREVGAMALYTGLYTVILAPYAHWGLRWARSMLGLSAVRTYRLRS